MIDMYRFEKEASSLGYKVVCGCDEAGRGPMAGPLVASCVVLNDNYVIEGLNDSKQLSAKARDRLFDEIMKHALVVEYEVISVEDVDRLNVYQASRYAMEKSISKSPIKIDYALTDAMPLTNGLPHKSIIKGDTLSASIAASSIVSKVIRDRIMEQYDKEYPNYGFKKHKGYCTKKHKQTIKEYGITPIHRQTFAPIIEVINKITK